MAEHGGKLVAKALKSRGDDRLFTLSGGHLFSIYDGCKAEGIELVDVRHEQTAAFAAEGIAKATRRVGVAALTAGPGVTNGMSAIAGAGFNGSPLCVLGGRAPEMRWGSGSLQEIDHLPFVSPLVKSAQTVKDAARIPELTAAALDEALEPPSGPTFIDYPLDVVFMQAEAEIPEAPSAGWGQPADSVDEPAALRAAAGGGPAKTSAWVEELRGVEEEKRASEDEELNDERAPLHPVRVYKDLREVLDREAIVIGDGGDFVSYAGRLIDTYEPGTWMDPGPFGCLGSGPGYAIAAKLARPERQVCLLLGDGAFGFAGMEFDTMVRHGIPVVAVMGNNGIWALEKHPMEFLYRYSVAADLQPGSRDDQVVEALGGHGELVERPDQRAPA